MEDIYFNLPGCSCIDTNMQKQQYSHVTNFNELKERFSKNWRTVVSYNLKCQCHDYILIIKTQIKKSHSYNLINGNIVVYNDNYCEIYGKFSLDQGIISEKKAGEKYTWGNVTCDEMISKLKDGTIFINLYEKGFEETHENIIDKIKQSLYTLELIKIESFYQFYLVKKHSMIKPARY
jgi:hypothetical protein